MDGFYVTDGLKFGVDLLLYTDKPSKVHSKYAILIDNNQTNGDILNIQRICTSVGKQLIIIKFDLNDFKMYKVSRFK